MYGSRICSLDSGQAFGPFGYFYCYKQYFSEKSCLYPFAHLLNYSIFLG